ELCKVHNNKGVVFVAKANESVGGLYALSMYTIVCLVLYTPVLTLATFLAGKCTTALDPHAHALANKKLVSNFSLSNHLHCTNPGEPCLLAKGHKLLFSSQSSHSNMPLDLVHTDICYPMDVEAIGGFRYLPGQRLQD
ncbi:hypothetical protein FRC11_009434, partial [Ceratobasidium sp. 423]